MKLDVLAFGAHPDDVELSAAGALLAESMKGKKTGIVDLTLGELGTRGNSETRLKEAVVAAKILGLSARENLELADGFFSNDQPTQLKVITAIRKYRPDIILCNALTDRHPDHGKGGRLVSDAAFLSGLQKIETFEDSAKQEPWRPAYVFHYVQDRFLKPDFVIDITDVFEKKMDSIRAYESQFYREDMEGPQTYIAKPGFMENVVNKHMLFGKMIGVKYGEGFITEKTPGLTGFDALIKNIT